VRVEQVLLNLVSNASDAMEAQAEGVLAITCAAVGAQAEITLRDSGPGIAEEVLPHLFEPFFTTKPAGKGLGLGLAISRLIVESLDGRLSAGNNPGGGAWFRVSLPLASETEP
jgi:two-component system C4-dicarboxylate transport sensor histidine kinase DctB